MFCFESVYHYSEMHFMYLMECFFFAFIFYIGNMLFEGTFSMNFFLDKKMLWKKFYIALKLSQFQKASIFTLFKVLTFIYVHFLFIHKDWYGMMDLPANSISKIVSHTSSSRTTRGWVTRVGFFNTTLAFTNVPRLTIRIKHTFRTATCDCIRFRNQSRIASAMKCCL